MRYRIHTLRVHGAQHRLGRFNLGSSIASKIKFALLFANCDILGIKIVRIDPLEPSIWLYCVYYDVLAAVFNPNVCPARELQSSSILRATC